jgi:hypothetical protein
MPQGTAVENAYQALRKKGYDKGMAARIAQSQTGEALATGRLPKHAVKACSAVATANEVPAPGDDLFRPSSQRTAKALTLSPGQRVLAELRQDRVRRQAAAKVINPLPEPIMAANTVGPPPPPPPKKSSSTGSTIKWENRGVPTVPASWEPMMRATERVRYENPTSAPPPPRSSKAPVAPTGQIATANEPPEDLTTPSSSRVTPSPGQKILQEARQATSAAEAASGLMKPGPDGVYQCQTCGYRADSPRPHNCKQILNRQQRNSPGWSGFRMPR